MHKGNAGEDQAAGCRDNDQRAERFRSGISASAFFLYLCKFATGSERPRAMALAIQRMRRIALRTGYPDQKG